MVRFCSCYLNDPETGYDSIKDWGSYTEADELIAGMCEWKPGAAGEWNHAHNDSETGHREEMVDRVWGGYYLNSWYDTTYSYTHSAGDDKMLQKSWNIVEKRRKIAHTFSQTLFINHHKYSSENASCNTVFHYCKQSNPYCHYAMPLKHPKTPLFPTEVLSFIYIYFLSLYMW